MFYRLTLDHEPPNVIGDMLPVLGKRVLAALLLLEQASDQRRAFYLAGQQS